jgi:hypothetical protein
VFHIDCPRSGSARTTPWCGTSNMRRSYTVRGSCRLLASSLMVCRWWTPSHWWHLWTGGIRRPTRSTFRVGRPRWVAGCRPDPWIPMCYTKFGHIGIHNMHILFQMIFKVTTFEISLVTTNQKATMMGDRLVKRLHCYELERLLWLVTEKASLTCHWKCYNDVNWKDYSDVSLKRLWWWVMDH